MALKNQPFDDLVKVAEKTEKEGGAGSYYAIKSDKNLVYNVNEHTYEKCGEIKVGKTYRMKGQTSPPRDGYTYGSRWVNSYIIESTNIPDAHKNSEPGHTVPGPTQPPATRAHEGFRTGQAMNLGVQMAIAKVGIDHKDFWVWVGFYADQALKFSYSYEKLAGKCEKPSEEEAPF